MNKLPVDLSLRMMLQWLLISYNMQILKAILLQSTPLLFHICTERQISCTSLFKILKQQLYHYKMLKIYTCYNSAYITDNHNFFSPGKITYGRVLWMPN